MSINCSKENIMIQKKAVGKYVGVRAINQKQAINLARRLFSAEGDKLHAERAKLYAEGDKFYAEGHKLYTEGAKLYAEGAKLYAEGRKLHADIAIKNKAYIPDAKAINIIAKDRDNSVYCFVFVRKELWIYDGENCPNSETVEKIDWRK